MRHYSSPVCISRPHRGRRSGFTLVEALVSSLILAAGVVVIGGLTQRCAHTAVRGLEYEQAYRLLDETLDRVTALGLPASDEPIVRGDFGPRHPAYHYQLHITPAQIPDLYDVTAHVQWHAGQHQYQVTAATQIYHGQSETTN